MPSNFDAPQETLDNNTDYWEGSTVVTPEKMKRVVDPTKCQHIMEKDDDDTDSYYGMVCKKCNWGYLVRK